MGRHWDIHNCMRGLYWLSHNDSLNSLQKEHPSIRIYTQLPSPTPASTISAATNAIATPTVGLSAQATNVDSTKTTIDEKATQSILCTIHDVLGEPVTSGNIQLGTATIPFRQGNVTIPDIPSEPFQLTASADGYQPATKTVHYKESDSVEFTLEYTCSYQVQVYGTGVMEHWEKKNGPLQAGAEVTLYRAALCQRPIQRSQQALIELHPYYFNPILYTLQYENSRISISQSAMIGSEKIFIESNHSPEFSTPQENDRVLSIGSCDKNQYIIQTMLNNLPGAHKAFDYRLYGYVIPLDKSNSLSARMLDTLQLSLKKKDIQNERLEILLSRNDKFYSSKCLYFPGFSGLGEKINQAYTDNSGTCHFDNLPPGLYYAQARYNNKTSMIRPLLPATGGAQLCLDTNCFLSMYTKRKDVPLEYNLQSENVRYVDITLQSKNQQANGVFMIQTDQDGRAQIKKIPYGQYTLNATPPKESNLSTIQQDIEISRPEQILNIEFDNWTKHTIEGTVVYYDSLKPIKDVHLELYENQAFYPSALTATDNEGRFTFDNLPKGTYIIRYVKKPNENITFCPYQESKASYLSYPFYYQWNDDELTTVLVSHEKKYTVQLKMIGAVATHLSGQVTDARQKPVSDAEIHLYRPLDFFDTMELPSPQYRILSDEKGFFNFTLLTRDISSMKRMQYQATLTAKTFGAVPLQSLQPSRINSVRGQVIKPDAKPRKSSGALKFKLAIGEDQKNLHITVDNQNLFTVEGRIKTEDGCVPEDAKVALMYTDGEALEINGEYKPDGEFTINGVENKEFLIEVKFAYCPDPADPNKIIEYLDEMIPLYKSQVNEFFDRKESGENLKVEITLKKTGNLNGVVLDANKTPVEGIMVRTNTDIGKSKWDYTDKNGKFHISQLKTDQKYPLFITKGESQPVQALAEIQPNAENIILQWKDEKEE